MGYKVLSRKYRPQSFEEVVQQEHVTRTLRNAIASGRLAHAILFAGPRGTGKTTIARILAKCVNCASGPSPVPCNICRSCKEIAFGNAVDVFEIDGASNNKVDNIRELRENAVYMPAHSPYKIYIIDEIHMLSDSAFNALLKILEEPPDHILFFFATTEPNKIPITILSRCQRHDLRRIDINAIIAHLENICQKEGVFVDKEGLTIIAREADGSVRDALSLLDHVISSASGKITTAAVLDIIGGMDRQVLFDISQAVFDRNTVNIIEIIHRLYANGQHMMRCFVEIMDHFRNLLMVKINGGKTVLSDVPQHEIEIMRRQIESVSATYLFQILDVLFKEEKNIKLAMDPKLTLEMAFLRVLQIQPALSLDALIEKIDILQKKIIKTLSASPQTHSPLTQSTPSSDTALHSGSEKLSLSEGVSPGTDCHAPQKPRDAMSTLDAHDSCPSQNIQPLSLQNGAAAAQHSVKDIWNTILRVLSNHHPMLAACFSHSQVKQENENQIIIEFKSNKFNANYAQREDHLQLLNTLWNEHLGRSVKLSLVPQPMPGDVKKNEKKILQDEALNHPIVAKALKLFGGKIVEIKIL